MEVAYALHEKSVLKTFDCLIPKIRSHEFEVGIHCEACKKKNRDAGTNKMYTLPVNIDQLREMNKLHNSRVPELEAENADLKEKMKAKDNELAIV